jgi:surface protein
MRTFLSIRLSLFKSLFITSLLFLLCSLQAWSLPFITRWGTEGPGGSSNNQIIIPATGSYHIDWEEDGNPGNNGSLDASGEVTVTFPWSGIYIVKISGGLTSIFFNNDTGKDRLKIYSVEQWGDIAWTTFAGAFYGCSSMTMKANDIPDLSHVTSMENMFSDIAAITGDISGWDVSHVTNMRFTFSGIYTLFSQDLDSWDVSHVTDMEGMFYYATTFNGNIRHWNVSNVTSIRYMFCTSAFNQDISGWDVSHVTNMEFTFNNNLVFNQNINSWDVSAVTDMSNMFNWATAFNQPLNNWNLSNVTETDWMFYGATAFNQDLSNWDVSKVVFFYRMFSGATAFDQDLSNWNITSANSMDFMLSNSGLSTAHYDALLNSWTNEPVKTNVPLGAHNLKYCNATASRNNLISSYGWTITGDALDCTALKLEETSAETSSSYTELPQACYPNPWDVSVNKTLTLQYIPEEQAEISLIDALGHTVYTENVQATDRLFTLSADKITGLRGVYMIRVTSRVKSYTSMVVIR